MLNLYQDCFRCPRHGNIHRKTERCVECIRKENHYKRVKEIDAERAIIKHERYERRYNPNSSWNLFLKKYKEEHGKAYVRPSLLKNKQQPHEEEKILG